MRVSWYEQTQHEVRPGGDWLSEWERLHLATLKLAKRRSDWLLGRWTAKHAVLDYCELPTDPASLSGIEIRPDEMGAPEVLVHGAVAEIAISLSHRNGLGACAIADGSFQLGCDVEAVELRSDAFVRDYFTPEEQAIIGRAPVTDQFATIALLWSAKESALKALRVGLRRSTHSVIVHSVSASELPPPGFNIDIRSPLIPPGESWQDLRVSCSAGGCFEGKWCCAGGVVRTVVVGMA